MKTPTLSNIKDYDVTELTEYLTANYIFTIPLEIDNSEDMKRVGELLSELGNSFAYISSLYAVCQADVRLCRRTKSKQFVEDAIDRRDVLSVFLNSIKMQHQTVSRMFTVRQEMNNELKMLGENYVPKQN